MSGHTRDDNAEGFTLIELLVYMMLAVLVLAIAGTMLLNALRTSNTTAHVTEASNTGQLLAESVEKGIRNSSDFLLTSPVGNDQFLTARTAMGGATLSWRCAAWYYSASGDGSVRYTSSDTAIAAPDAATLATWTLLDEDIKPASGTTIFSRSGDRLSISFHGLAGDQPPVAISSSAQSRAGATGNPAC